MQISVKPIFLLTMKNQIEIPIIEADTGMFNQYNITEHEQAHHQTCNTTDKLQKTSNEVKYPLFHFAAWKLP